MKVAEMVGPGVDTWLKEKVLSWGYTALTDIQRQAIQAGIADGLSMVVCAPTSSGKTLIGEIAILQALRAGMRAIYLVSHRALADQKFIDFSNRFGENAVYPLASVALSTGDREEGEIDSQLAVATYEKALGLLLAGRLKLNNALVVADEAQIIGEDTRGPEVETFCSICRRDSVRQFLALTASLGNSADLAGWMKCGLVTSDVRDVPLHQEIWFSGKATTVTFGQRKESTRELGDVQLGELSQVVQKLLDLGRAPVLVFTETKREALEGANAFRQSRPRIGDGITFAEQLELFSEPTDASDNLRESAERRVIFHTADLSPQERQVIEAGFLDSRFDVCFATSTLAAGVNFPFRSVVFPRITYHWGTREGKRIGRSDYRNMSGRAGRLGIHTEGFSILLPTNRVEYAHCANLVLPENDILRSRFFSISLRKTILSLVGAGIAESHLEVMALFENTLYWHQVLEKSPEKYSLLETQSTDAIAWLVANELLTDTEGVLKATQLGKASALSGFLPVTTVALANMLREIVPMLETSFDEWADGLIYAICHGEEFAGENASRFLPFPAKISIDSFAFWSGRTIPVPLDRNDARLAQCTHAVCLYASGLAERKISFQTRVSAGLLHRLCLDVAWVLDGLHKIACIPGMNCSQAVSNKIASLGRRVRWGAPVEALDLIRLAEREGVPGFGRQRAMALVAQGISTLHELLAAEKEKIAHVLRNEKRAEALLAAALRTAGLSSVRLIKSQIRTAKRLGIEALLEACEKSRGVEYEKAIASLMRVESSWTVTLLDDGSRQNVPDLLVRLGTISVLIECKTCEKLPPLIKKEEAWAILQKAADFEAAIHRVTLGKPAFDETSKKKVAAAHDLTLVEHELFVEGLLRVHAGSCTPSEFLSWLSTPGLSESERLAGTPTYRE